MVVVVQEVSWPRKGGDLVMIEACEALPSVTYLPDQPGPAAPLISWFVLRGPRPQGVSAPLKTELRVCCVTLFLRDVVPFRRPS